MKTGALKKLIKEAVKEVFQEELKEVLLESLKASKTTTLKEHNLPSINLSSKDVTPSTSMRTNYMELLGDMASGIKKGASKPYDPTGVDPINGSLPEGELSMDQIMNLIPGNK